MEKIIDLSPFGHAKSSQIKELIYERGVDDKSGIYKVHAEWPDNPNIGTLRVGYDDKSKEISFIDFDGGPFLQKGSKISNYTVRGFSDYDDWPIRIILSNELSN